MKRTEAIQMLKGMGERHGFDKMIFAIADDLGESQLSRFVAKMAEKFSDPASEALEVLRTMPGYTDEQRHAAVRKCLEMNPRMDRGELIASAIVEMGANQ